MNADDDNDLDPAMEQRLTDLARSISLEDRALLAPPEDLWFSIEAALGDEHASRGPSPAVAARPTVVRPVPALDEEASAVPDLVERSQWRRRPPLLAVAAALVLVVGAVGLVASQNGGDEARDLAAGELEPLLDGYQGDATVREVDDRLELVVDLDPLPPTDAGYYELWLIKSLETGEMQSLGPIEESGVVALPAGLDPAEYAVVDISIEPLDGVPTHSGQSVLRGALES